MHETDNPAKLASDAIKKYQDSCIQGAIGTMSGRLNNLADPEYKPTLRDRLKRQIESAGREQKRSRCANELFDLLNKNPEVARIFELMEEIS